MGGQLEWILGKQGK